MKCAVMPFFAKAFVIIVTAFADGANEYPFTVSQVPSAFTMLHIESISTKRSGWGFRTVPSCAPGRSTQAASPGLHTPPLMEASQYPGRLGELGGAFQTSKRPSLSVF